MGDIAATYADRSVIARLAAALLAVQAWSARTGVTDPAAEQLQGVLWAFPTVGGPTFGPWHDRYETDPLRRDIAGLEAGEPVEAVARVQRAATAAGVSPAPLLSGLLHASGIVGDNLFAAVDHTRTLEHLHAVEVLVARDGVDLVPASTFPDQAATDFHGWGNPVDPATVERWRARTV
ncbi:hypothetical protein ACXR2U_20785 [Jatrophihabitans sp. YIM 134969]